MVVAATRRTYRVTIGEDDTRILADLQLNESFDQLCNVAEFSLATRPSDMPAVGDSVLVESLELSAGRAYPLFGGTVNIVTAESQPWNYRVTCCDQLEKLRRIRTSGDLDLTGLSDREAWMAIADACDIDYDPDDIMGNGYDLGAYVPVKWHADNSTSGGAVIQELDEVFGYKTMTVGNNRVIRIFVDQVPSGTTGLYKTYTRGVNVDFLGNRRQRGDRDQLQNSWMVTGVVDEISESCTAQVWAKSQAGSGYLASKRVQVPGQSFHSDFIQHESLAEAIVRRKMALTNRLPDALSIRVLDDHNIHVGSKLRIIDNTRGIGAAAGIIGCVRSLVRSGFECAIELIVGPGGDEGTVTHGTQKTCNKSTTDIDRPGDYGDGDTGFPPLIDGTDEDFDIGDGTDADDSEDDVPQPVEGCQTDESFSEDCDESDSDFCNDGSSSTEDLSGTSPANFCRDFLSPGSGYQTKSFTAGGIGYSTRCQVLVPWRESSGTGQAFYHVNDDGAVDWVQTINSDTAVSLVANSETDPDLQTEATNVVFGSPLIATVSGVVAFWEPGSALQIQFLKTTMVGPVLTEGVGGATVNIYADPGLSVSRVGADPKIVGVRVSCCFLSPQLVGDPPPNFSSSLLYYNNGGYVDSTPAALGVPVAFTFQFDMTHKNGWGWTFGSTDLGSGYIDNLDFINSASPLPGEPSDPSNTCADGHTTGHFLKVTMNPGGAGTFDEPGVRLYGLVIGSQTCESGEDFHV